MKNDGRFHDYMKGYMVGSSLGNSRPSSKPRHDAPSDARSVVFTLLGWVVGGTLAVIILALLGR